MAREMIARGGKVSDSLGESLIYHDEHLQVSAGGFLFRTPGNVRFLYRRGQGLVIDQPGPEAADECSLYLNGTVFGAVAWLNGLVPIHASCVEGNGRAVAFTADSGGGKSTLAAALAARGFAHVCDDTLILEPGDRRVVGHPDGKSLKLWEDAFEFAPASREKAIGFVPGKTYARPARRATEPVNLTDLVFIDYGAECRLEPIRGAEKALRLPETFYRDFIHFAHNGALDHARIVRQIIANVRFWKGVRPRGKAHFVNALDMFSSLLRAEAAD